jgi:hypothetical protein
MLDTKISSPKLRDAIAKGFVFEAGISRMIMHDNYYQTSLQYEKPFGHHTSMIINFSRVMDTLLPTRYVGSGSNKPRVKTKSETHMHPTLTSTLYNSVLIIFPTTELKMGSTISFELEIT